ncbi:MAG TPA: KH domain-containing protein [Thermoanaerobaculia bacterium]|nr:KH domain-containing protein [Thermoanaerobaculia bacterium]
MPELKDDFEELARLLVDQPEEVEVTEIPGRRDSVLELKVAPDDLGKVIGRQGRTARALRTLLDTRADRLGERYELEILEDE